MMIILMIKKNIIIVVVVALEVVVVILKIMSATLYWVILCQKLCSAPLCIVSLIFTIILLGISTTMMGKLRPTEFVQQVNVGAGADNLLSFLVSILPLATYQL